MLILIVFSNFKVQDDQTDKRHSISAPNHSYTATMPPASCITLDLKRLPTPGLAQTYCHCHKGTRHEQRAGASWKAIRAGTVTICPMHDILFFEKAPGDIPVEILRQLSSFRSLQIQITPEKIEEILQVAGQLVEIPADVLGHSPSSNSR